MIKYLRTFGNSILKIIDEDAERYFLDKGFVSKFSTNIKKVAESVEDLIEIDDIVFYWCSSDNKEHAMLVVYNWDIPNVQGQAITKLFVPAGGDYKLMGKAEHDFVTIEGKDGEYYTRFLKSRNRLESLY